MSAPTVSSRLRALAACERLRAESCERGNYVFAARDARGLADALEALANNPNTSPEALAPFQACRNHSTAASIAVVLSDLAPIHVHLRHDGRYYPSAEPLAPQYGNSHCATYRDGEALPVEANLSEFYSDALRTLQARIGLPS